MKKNLETLLSQSAVYVFFEFLNKGLLFFLIPVFTRYLNPEDFGVVATFMVLVNAFGVFTGINVHGAVQVNYFQKQKQEFRIFVTNVMLVLLTTFILVLLVVALSSHWLEELTNVSRSWILVAVICAASQFLTTINLVLWQVENKAKFYGLYQLLQTLLNAGVSLALIIYIGMGSDGRLSGFASATIFFAVMSFIVIFRRNFLSFKYDRAYIKEILQFGIPLIPHRLAIWLRSDVDRILLTSMIGLSATGIYYIGFQVGMVIGILTAAFNKAFAPYLFTELKNIDDTKKVNIVKFTYAYFAILLFVAVFLGLMAEKYLVYVLGEVYSESSSVVFWVSLGFAFDGMYLMVVNYIFYEKKTRILALITLFTGVVHVLLSFLFIKMNGIVGAAQATACSYLLSFLLVWVASSRIYKLPWNFVFRPVAGKL
jgi:O-antigen/teichoic acid export membrane protein